jgi:hypothetical protein
LEEININCEFCHQKLNHLLVRQLIKNNNEILVDVECVNPECQRHNYMSEDAYFYLKDDFLDKPLVLKKNLKLPSEMSVIFVSMKSCGISWIIRELSKYHKAMFGKPIIFTPNNAEISTQIATKPRFPLPKGFNNVYGVDPQLLLDKVDPDGNRYDRVVVIHRPLEELLNVYKIRMGNEKLNLDFVEKLLEKAKVEYNNVYHEIEDPRLLRIDLWDANQYTEAIFNELMDFLNFPTYMRPPVVRVKTLSFMALMEAYSSVWDKNFKLTGMLGRVEGLFKLTYDGILEYLAKNAMVYNKKKITLKNVLVVGPRIHSGSHFSENIFYAFNEKGYNTELLSLEKLGWGKPECEIYKQHKQLYPLSKALEVVNMKPDLIVFDEPAWCFYNDVDIPVFYTHREFKRPPKVFYPDIALFWHVGVANYFKKMFAPYWAGQIPKLEVLSIAVDLKRFKPNVNKTIKGITLLMGREAMSACVSMNELTAVSTLYESIREIREVISLGINVYDDPDKGLSNERFRELLPQCEAIWCHIPTRQYVSRRILEAMACKTLCVIKIENEEHENVLYDMGFQAGVHYLKIDKISEMKKMHENWNFKNVKYMIENAYKVVTENHSFLNRVDQLVDLYMDYGMRYKGVVVE